MAGIKKADRVIITWQPDMQRVPVIGDITHGEDIGHISGKQMRKQWYFWTACPKCGKERWVAKCKLKYQEGRCYACRPLKGIWRLECSHRSIQYGYVKVKLQPDSPFYSMIDCSGYVKEHRLIVAQHLGRPLLKTEVVHHKNGIRSDNRLENLELTPSVSAHSILTTQCQNCGLRKEIRLLHWQIKELREALQQKLKLE